MASSRAASAADTGLVIIPAVELSAVHGGRTLHILGYHIDHTSAPLRAQLAELRSVRLERARSIVDALRADGYQLFIGKVTALINCSDESVPARQP